MTRSTEQQ